MRLPQLQTLAELCTLFLKFFFCFNDTLIIIPSIIFNNNNNTLCSAKQWLLNYIKQRFRLNRKFFNHFHGIHHFQTAECGILLAYITVNVHSDVIQSQLQQHLFQRWTAFQQRIVDELIEQWRIQTPRLCVCTFNSFLTVLERHCGNVCGKFWKVSYLIDF